MPSGKLLEENPRSIWNEHFHYSSHTPIAFSYNICRNIVFSGRGSVRENRPPSFHHGPQDVRASELSTSHVEANWLDKSLDNRKQFADTA
jgi:hypothetical protein